MKERPGQRTHQSQPIIDCHPPLRHHTERTYHASQLHRRIVKDPSLFTMRRRRQISVIKTSSVLPKRLAVCSLPWYVFVVLSHVRHSSIGYILHHSQELEMYEDVTRWLHLPRLLRTRLAEPATLKPPTHRACQEDCYPASTLQLTYVPILPFSYISDDAPSTSTLLYSFGGCPAGTCLINLTASQSSLHLISLCCAYSFACLQD